MTFMVIQKRDTRCIIHEISINRWIWMSIAPFSLTHPNGTFEGLFIMARYEESRSSDQMEWHLNRILFNHFLWSCVLMHYVSRLIIVQPIRGKFWCAHELASEIAHERRVMNCFLFAITRQLNCTDCVASFPSCSWYHCIRARHYGSEGKVYLKIPAYRLPNRNETGHVSNKTTRIMDGNQRRISSRDWRGSW
jgi:hypothetical protein